METNSFTSSGEMQNGDRFENGANGLEGDKLIIINIRYSLSNNQSLSILKELVLKNKPSQHTEFRENYNHFIFSFFQYQTLSSLITMVDVIIDG